MGDDEALLDVVTSVNVACGFHAGDPVTMLRTCRAAAARGVTVGTHPSYPDLVGFGRRHLGMSAEELTAATVYQVGALDACCRAAGTRLSYVKPHGALYHDVSCDAALARAFLLGVVEVAPLAVLGPAGSELLKAAAELGLRTAPRPSLTAATDRTARSYRVVSPVRSSTTRTRSPSAWSAW